jgi:hypothetical protein
MVIITVHAARSRQPSTGNTSGGNGGFTKEWKLHVNAGHGSVKCKYPLRIRKKKTDGVSLKRWIP